MISLEIIWKGNEYTNSSSRKGYIPCAVVDHISAGSMSSMDNWFTSPTNKVSSAHYGVAKDGRIHQYVEIERFAWAQGIEISSISHATAQIVHDHGINPNFYCVSIEHEGMDGELTEAQFAASVWLHLYVRQYIVDHWGSDAWFPLDPYHVVGHYQIDPLRKMFCPGPLFPWARLYASLKEADEEMSLSAEVAVLKEQVRALSQAASLSTIPDWAKPAVDAATTAGLIDSPEGGSYDFYRLLTVLHRKNII